MPITEYEQYMNGEGGKGIVSRYAEHKADTFAAAGAIPWGAAVMQQPGFPNRCVVYNGAGGIFLGIAIAQNYANIQVADVNADVPGAYIQFDAVSVLRKGVIWVPVLEPVTKNQSAVIDNVTGSFRQLGSATTAVSGAIGVYKSSALAGGLAELEINIP